jgi:hypothetical protein
MARESASRTFLPRLRCSSQLAPCGGSGRSCSAARSALFKRQTELLGRVPRRGFTPKYELNALLHLCTFWASTAFNALLQKKIGIQFQLFTNMYRNYPVNPPHN